MHDFSAEQQAKALLTPIAPPDMVMLNRPYVVEQALPALTPGIDDSSAVATQFQTMERLAKDRNITLADLEPVRYSSTPKGIATADMTAPRQREIS